MKGHLILLFLLIPVHIISQNLVPNNSFETMNGCPASLGQYHLADSWFSPNTGTPDYFNNCSATLDFGTEFNCKGGQLPKTGQGYMGFSSANLHRNPFYEYIETRLKEPLEKGQEYCVKMYVSLGNTNCALRELGVVFSQTPLKGISSPSKIQVPFTPVVNGRLLSDTQDWICIRGKYTGKGGETFLTIGDFSTENSFITTKEDPRLGESFQTAYYFIDDISVEKITESNCDCEVQN